MADLRNIIFCLLCSFAVNFSNFAIVHTKLLDPYTIPPLLRFTAGDVICCRLENSFLQYAEHSVLATTNSTVVAEIGRIFEVNFLNMTITEGFKKCRIATWEYDRIMFSKGVSPRDTTEAVESARTWARGNLVTAKTYDQFECNCQHWVTAWKYGKAWSVQSNQPPADNCPLTKDYSFSKASAAMYSKPEPWQYGGRAAASVGRASSNGLFSTYIEGPSASVVGELGTESTGGGLQASLGKVGFNLGNVAGIQLSVALDTEANVGKDGFNLKVLGTGLQVSHSKRFSLCFVGSCLYVG